MIFGSEKRTRVHSFSVPVSPQVSKPQDESTSPRCRYPSDTARLFRKTRSSRALYSLLDDANSVGFLSLSHRHRYLFLNHLRNINSPNSQLFSVCASLCSSAPLLSPLLSWRTQVSCSSHSTFHFSLPLPPPQPLGMCRLDDSREIQRGGWLQASPPITCNASRACFSFLRIVSCWRIQRVHPWLPEHGIVCAPVPGRKRLLSAVNFKVTGPGVGEGERGQGEVGMGLLKGWTALTHSEATHFYEPTQASKRGLLSTCSSTFSRGALVCRIFHDTEGFIFVSFISFFQSHFWSEDAKKQNKKTLRS